MPRLTILLLSLVLGAGSAVLVACGGDDGPDGAGIPPENADGLINELGVARTAFEAGDCAKVEESAAEIAAAATALGDGDPPLDPEIEDGLTQGADQLAELARTSSDCEEQTTTTTDEPKDETTATEPTTTPETTTPEETTTTTTTQEEEPPPSDEDGGGPPIQPPGQDGDGGIGAGGTGGVGGGER